MRIGVFFEILNFIFFGIFFGRSLCLGWQRTLSNHPEFHIVQGRRATDFETPKLV